MNTTWLLVADHRRAHLFGVDPDLDSLCEIESFDNVTGVGAARNPDGAAGADARRPTPLGDPGAPARGAATRFAHELCEIIERGLAAASCARVMIVAPPRFATQLEAAFNEDVRHHVWFGADDGAGLGADDMPRPARLPFEDA